MAAGDRLLCGIADMYRRQVGERGICGRLSADQFACLLEFDQEFTAEMFIRSSDEINKLQNAKNVAVKWGIYSVESQTVPVDQLSLIQIWVPLPLMVRQAPAWLSMAMVRRSVLTDTPYFSASFS